MLWLTMFCYTFSFTLRLQDGVFQTYPDKPSGWTHVVLNYIGPNAGQGISIYYNGARVGRDTSKHLYQISTGDGRIVVGRLYTERDLRYASIDVDELIFFNQSLSTTVITGLHNLFYV